MKALLIILAVLVLIAWIPLKCVARFIGAPQVDVRVGPVRFTVFPTKVKPKKAPKAKKEKKPKTPKPEQPKEAKKSSTPDGILQYIPLVQTALETLGRLFRATSVTLKVHVTYGAEDVADAAIRYGQAWAIIGTITPVLENTFTVRKRDLQAVFDPDQTGFSIEADLKARLFVWQIIAIAVSAGVKILIQFLRIRKGGAKK